MRSLRTVKAPKVVREGNSNPLPLGMGSRQNTAKLQTIIAEGKAIVESLEASKRELQRRARERAVQIRRYQIAEEL